MQAGASLQTADLQKNGAASTDAIYKLIYSGKGKMPGYGKECTPRVESPTLPGCACMCYIITFLPSHVQCLSTNDHS